MRVPFDSRADRHDSPRCPWCGHDCASVSLTLGAINTAHVEDLIWRDGRKADLVAEPGTLSARCPSCGRGFGVALQAESWSGEPVMRLYALREPADGWVSNDQPVRSPGTAHRPVIWSGATKCEGQS